MTFNEVLQILLEQEIALPKATNPVDQAKLLGIIKNKNLELKKQKKVLKYDSKTGKAAITPRTPLDDKADIALNKLK